MTISGPLDERYFRWLYSRISKGRPKDPPRTWWKLLRLMHQTEFIWFVANDSNRVEDGRELRDVWLDGNALELNERHWMTLGCSVLEMMIALSGRLAFEGGGEQSRWFWVLIFNLGLQDMNDEGFDQRKVEEVLNMLIWRQYDEHGRGGLFPLLYPSEHDQRELEIYYQMQDWLYQTQWS